MVKLSTSSTSQVESDKIEFLKWKTDLGLETMS